MEIQAPTTTDAWKAVLNLIMTKGKDFKDDEDRTCREILNLSVTIENPDVAPDEPVERIRKFDKWFYPSKEELVNIIFNQYDLPLYEYTYGSRLFGYQGKIDQINSYVIPLLKKNPTSRRATIVVVDPQEDAQMHNRNAPALVSLHFKIDDGKLRLTSVIRSNDYFIGWPANIYQLAMLQRYVAQELSARVGALTTYSVSAHLFDEYFEDIEEVLQ